MAISFQKAKREQLWLKILLAGPSGSGKTYTALRLASGIAKECNSRIAAIDTENGRIRYYANEFDFDDIQFEAPFTPENYIEAIEAAVDGGYKVLIIDSSTHEWDYCLDVHNKMPGNSYTNWAKITPRHDAFMEKMLQSPIHIITTVRGKDEYVLEEKNGKQTPKKVGLGYKQRDGMEYNYTCTFNIAQDTHIASVMKDNTHLFEDRYDVLTEEDGEAIYNWANSGDAPAKMPKAEPAPAPVPEDLPSKILKIDSLAKSLQAKGVAKGDIVDAIKSVMGSTANYNRITDMNMADDVLAKLNELEEN